MQDDGKYAISNAAQVSLNASFAILILANVLIKICFGSLHIYVLLLTLSQYEVFCSLISFRPVQNSLCDWRAISRL